MNREVSNLRLMEQRKSGTNLLLVVAVGIGALVAFKTLPGGKPVPAPPSSVSVMQKITVWGPHDGIARFTALHDGLVMSSPESLGADGERITMAFPKPISGGEVVHLTSEALAAGLSYSFESVERTGQLPQP